MKKILALILASLMLFALTACGGNTETTTSTTEQPESSQAQGSDNGENVAPVNAGANTAEADCGVTLPENLKIKTKNNTIYKIGDDFMVDSGSYDYYHYNGNGEYDVYYWDNGGFQDGGGTITLESFLDCTWKKRADDFEKTSETKEICGKTCTKFYDAGAKAYAYVNEDLGIIFEEGFEDASSSLAEISEWDDTITSFPTEAPQI